MPCKSQIVNPRNIRNLISLAFAFLLQEAISGLEDEVALGTGDQDLDLMLFLLAVQEGLGSYCV